MLRCASTIEIKINPICRIDKVEAIAGNINDNGSVEVAQAVGVGPSHFISADLFVSAVAATPAATSATSGGLNHNAGINTLRSYYCSTCSAIKPKFHSNRAGT